MKWLYLLLIVAVAFAFSGCASSVNTLVTNNASSLEQNITINEEVSKLIVPQKVQNSAEMYLRNILSNESQYLKFVDGKYAFPGMSHEVPEPARSTYASKIIEGASYKQCFVDSTYGQVCVEVERGQQPMITYYDSAYVYELNFGFSYPDQESQFKLFVSENGAIYTDYYNPLLPCEKNSSKCPPFDVSKSDALKIMNANITPRTNYYWHLSLQDHYLRDSREWTYVWQGAYCPEQNSRPDTTGPIPLGSRCEIVLVNVYTGALVAK